MLIVEDMHWADRSTRDLLAFLIRNQGSAEGLLIVVDYRSDDLHRTHPLRPLLAELDRIGWVARLDLGRLARQDTAELVAQITGRRRTVTARGRVRRTEGNPLFVEALLGDGGNEPTCRSRCATCWWPVSGGCPRRPRTGAGSRARAASGPDTGCWPRSPGSMMPSWPARCGRR